MNGAMRVRTGIAALFAVACALASGCAAARTSSAIDRAEIVKAATFDHGCREDAIHVVEDRGAAPSDRFVVDVCGSRRHYQRIGTMYVDIDRARAAN